MVPVLLLSLRRGWRIGIFGGVVFGLVALIQDAGTGIYYPAQVLIDYPLAFGSLGLAGFLRKTPYIGVSVAIAARFLFHFASGILFFASFAAGFCSQPIFQSLGDTCTFPAVYSAIYNGSFLLPELVISLVVVRILVQLKGLEIYI
jgi:thiamine transporter